MTVELELDTRPDDLVDVAEVLRRAADDIRDALDALAAASALLTASWTGEAAEAYARSYSAFAREAAVQASVLEGAGQALGDLARAYATTDERGALTLPH